MNTLEEFDYVISGAGSAGCAPGPGAWLASAFSKSTTPNSFSADPK